MLMLQEKEGFMKSSENPNQYCVKEKIHFKLVNSFVDMMNTVQ